MKAACKAVLLLAGIFACASAEGNVGCLFSKSLCLDQVEWCFDDYAFGKCQPNIEDGEPADLYRYNLRREALHMLEREMERLYTLGYRWSHSYTQCVLQFMLDSIREGVEYDDAVCIPFADQDLNAALKALESEEEQNIAPNGVAHVKFTPSVFDPHADFADEVYSPEREQLLDERLIGVPENIIRAEDIPDVSYRNIGDDSPLRQLLLDKPKRSRKRLPAPYGEEEEPAGMYPIEDFLEAPTAHFSEDYNTPDNFRLGIEERDLGDLIRLGIAEEEMEDSDDLEGAIKSVKSFSRNYNTPDTFRLGFETKDIKTPDGEERVTSFSRNYNTPENFRNGHETRDGYLDQIRQEYLNSPGSRELVYDTFRDVPEDRLSHDLEVLADQEEKHDPRSGDNVASVFTEGGTVYLKDDDKGTSDLEELMNDYKMGWGFKRPERLDVKKPGPNFNTNNFAFKVEKDKTHASLEKIKGALPTQKTVPKQVTPPVKKPASLPQSPQFSDFVTVQLREGLADWSDGMRVINAIANLLKIEKYAFSHARVDLDNELIFQMDLSRTNVNASEVAKRIDGIKGQLEKYYGIEVTAIKVGDRSISNTESNPLHLPVEVVKKKSPSGKPFNSNVESGDDALIQVKEGIHNWTDGVQVLFNIAKLLNMDKNAFAYPRVVQPNGILFKMDPSRTDINISEAAKRIASITGELKADFGVEITTIKIGDKVIFDASSQPTYLYLTLEEEHRLWMVSFLLCGVIAAVAIAGAVFFVVKRHARTRDKLNGLSQPDSEASKDYQDLCRARMAAKTAQDKPDTVVGRITALGKDGDNNQSPSSRSSTSSWSEEPALTNMDISTGHMVLSYMEDHLKNKDRLEQEWIALCAYEAEPCGTVVASKADNVKKNRYPDVVPYDHARVVLNELMNVSGSDYINASTITDHDPRNPAYIATQGPLPNTAADLWQMVWEQGSVVMVMLTRITENGTAMCHRYWPEEGSEVYHIYEVHLVSEHIWCDDYLVRSFYLKNLKTGETRTVTQFHFLSWPENGVPLSTKALLEFRRKVNKSYRGRSCPIVVHCSDGTGRTGTYCLIDMVLNRMAKGAKEIDIAATLEHIRDQRPLMVKTKQQFEFVLMAVAEEVHAILKALPATHSPPPVVKEKE